MDRLHREHQCVRASSAFDRGDVVGDDHLDAMVTQQRDQCVGASEDVEAGSIRPPGRGAVRYTLTVATAAMITSANTIHRALRQRWTTVGVTVCVVIGPPSRCLSQAPRV